MFPPREPLGMSFEEPKQISTRSAGGGGVRVSHPGHNF